MSSQASDSSAPLAHIFQAYREANPQRDYGRINGQAKAAGIGREDSIILKRLRFKIRLFLKLHQRYRAPAMARTISGLCDINRKLQSLRTPRMKMMRPHPF